MKLAFNFLLIILVELPIITLFFKRKKRQQAIYMALLINIISWSVAHVIFFSTDISIYYVAALVTIGEAIAFHYLMDCNWKKAIIMSLLVNSLSFLVTQVVPVDEIFAPKQETIRTSTAE